MLILFAFFASLRETSWVQTILTTSPGEAAKFIKRGGLAAFPTETVYGLGANVFDEKAVARIFEAKQRPQDNPLIAHVGSIEQISELALEIKENACVFIDEFFPGPLTVVLKKTEQVPLIATGGLDTIGVRMPRHILAREFLNACGTPVAAPSANLSGRPSPTMWEAVFEDLDGRIDCILQGETTEIGLESTVVDCTADVPVVLRLGAVSVERLREVVPETRIYKAKNADGPRSPGLKHKHYAPRARVILTSPEFDVADSQHAAFIGLNAPDAEFELVKICNSVEDYAHSVFEFFRECDRRGIDVIYCESVDEKGIGAALMDRLRRAAES